MINLDLRKITTTKVKVTRKYDQPGLKEDHNNKGESNQKRTDLPGYVNRQTKQLEDPTDTMRECKRLIKKFECEIKEEQGMNSSIVTKQLNDEKQSMILENKLESMQIMENKLESMKILENKLESLKLQENQPVDGLVPLSIKKFTSESVLPSLLKKNHRKEEDQEGNNSSKIETLLLFPIHGGFHHDFFGTKALDLSSDHIDKVMWYVLHNSPEIDTYRSQFKSHNESRTTQNNCICSPSGKDKDMYYGQLQEILEFSYLLSNLCCSELSGSTLATKDVIEHVNHKKFSNGGVIVVEDDPDVIHFDNSSDLALFADLNDLDFATLHIDGQSTDVDAPPDIIDVDEDGDIIDDEDALWYLSNYTCERKARKGQNQNKTGQKQEAWKSPAVSKANYTQKSRKEKKIQSSTDQRCKS
nr:putative plant SNARE 13 [Tanacetum cinerariifolium]